MKKIILLSFYIWEMALFSVFAQNTENQAIKPVAQAVINYGEGLQDISLFVPSENVKNQSVAAQYVRNANLLQIDGSQLLSFVQAKPDAIALHLPTKNGQEIVFQLLRYEVLMEGAVIGTISNGEKQPAPYTDGIHYRGFIKGNPHSLVAISFFENDMMGFFSDENDNHIIGKIGENSGDEYVVYAEKDLLIQSNFTCENAKLPQIKQKALQQSGGMNTNQVNGCVKVYFECDYQLFLDKSSNTTTVNNYVTGLFNQTAAIYQNESIATQISSIFVWTSLDPYPFNDSFDALNAFGQAKQDNFVGDLAHLLSTRNNNNGGIAWLDVLCNSYFYFSSQNYHTGRFAYSNIHTTYSNFPTFSWSVECVTHEMGHNLGSPHTHACEWNGNSTAIDGCYPVEGSCAQPGNPTSGTIMSYCHLVSGVGINFANGFGTQPGNLIRSAITAASCIVPCVTCPATASLTGTYTTTKTEVTNYITATCIIPNGANVTFDAANYIRLLPGFKATLGSKFYARIDGCGGLRMANDNDLVEGNAPIEMAISTPENLFAIVPNPMTDEANIVFYLAKNEHIQVEIWDMLGNKIATPLSNTAFSSGEHAIRINAQNWAKGLYICRLYIGNEVKVKQMVLY